MDTTVTSQTIKLRDGRTLGYAEWGDFKGKPLFLFAGSNSARFARHPDDEVLVEMGIHLYTFDRPGMGLSDPQPGRRLLDWAEDVRDFASQKQIPRFAIVAASQGGPYGAACAYALPDLLSSVSLVSAVSPLDDPAVMATQNRMIRAQIFIARHFPGLMTLQMKMMRPLLNGNRPQKMFRAVFKNLPPGDQVVMNSTNMIDVLVQDMREGMRQGGRGGGDDMRAVVTDWDFKLEDIRTKVFLWQGEADPNVTPAMGRYLAARIPNCEATFVPNAGHFLMYTHWRQILSQLIENFNGNLPPG
jgi:pimeloyl-ACP methyl ester carboxylesterase